MVVSICALCVHNGMALLCDEANFNDGHSLVLVNESAIGKIK